MVKAIEPKTIAISTTDVSPILTNGQFKGMTRDQAKVEVRKIVARQQERDS